MHAPAGGYTALMSFLALLLTLLGLLSPARASEQKIVYDLTLDGRVVGTRELVLTYVDPATPADVEARLVRSWTTVDAPLGRETVRYRSRGTSRNTDARTAFTVVTEEGGVTIEVQGRQLDDGSWATTITSRGRREAFTHRRLEVDLCTFDLVDPVRARRLAGRPSANVLLAETGQIVTGAVREERAAVTIGGQSVPVTRLTWSPPVGALSMAYTEDGLLVAYEAAFLGKTLQARARALPPPRDYGRIDTAIAPSLPPVEVESEPL